MASDDFFYGLTAGILAGIFLSLGVLAVLGLLVPHGYALLPGTPCNCWEGAYTGTMINCLHSGNLSSSFCEAAKTMFGV